MWEREEQGEAADEKASRQVWANALHRCDVHWCDLHRCDLPRQVWANAQCGRAATCRTHLQQGLLLLAPPFASQCGVMQQGHPARTCKMERRLKDVSVKRSVAAWGGSCEGKL